MIVKVILGTVLTMSVIPSSESGPTKLWRVFDVRGVDPELVPSKFPPPLPPFPPMTTTTTESYPPKPDPEDMVQWYRYAAEKKPRMSMEASRREESDEDPDSPLSRMPPIPRRHRRRPKKLDQEDDEGNFNPGPWSWYQDQPSQNGGQGRESRQKKYKKATGDDEFSRGEFSRGESSRGESSRGEFSSSKRFIPEGMEVKPPMKESRRQPKYNPMESSEEGGQQSQDTDHNNGQYDGQNNGQYDGQNSGQYDGQNNGQYDGGSNLPGNEYVRRQMMMLMGRKSQFAPQSDQEDGSQDDWNKDDDQQEDTKHKQRYLEEKPRNDDGQYGGKFLEEKPRNDDGQDGGKFFGEPEINPYEYRMNKIKTNASQFRKRHFGIPQQTDDTDSYSLRKDQRQDYS